MPSEPSDASEFTLIDRYFKRPTPDALLGPGDDCALLAPTPGMVLACSTDMLVAGTHFFPDCAPAAIGWKTLAVNLSDLAAMGAQARWALLAGALPQADAAWLTGFSAGFFACARRYGVELVGGDTTRGPLNLCVTVLGEVPAGQALQRNGATAGDDVWISGQPGLAALGLCHLQGKVELPAELAKIACAALERPQPRLALGQRLRGIASAAIDVSDGLAADLGHILRASGLRGEIHETMLPLLPPAARTPLGRRCQLSGGDAYELCFTASPLQRPAIAALAAALELPLWRIGSAAAATPAAPAGSLRVIASDGSAHTLTETGYDHFA